MPATAQLSASVLICTYNRAALLRETLESLKRIRSTRRWDVLIVDNNSTDETRQVVESMASGMPVPLAYVFEPRQGKSNALNTGLSRARGEVVVFTDDDVDVGPAWLDAACGPIEQDPAIDYTGGPVTPRWEVPPPPWLDLSRGDLWGTLAILDYGAEPFVFEERRRIPLGVNFAVRRALVERAGGFHPELGRRGRSLLGQEQAEFLTRGQRLGAKGLYVPEMKVAHHVPASRLTRHYFRRWWFWKGISRARVDAMHQRTELGLDLRTVPRLAGVPRYVWGQLPQLAWQLARAAAAADHHAAMRHQMHLIYVLGYIRACWAPAAVPGPAPMLPRGDAAPLAGS